LPYIDFAIFVLYGDAILPVGWAATNTGDFELQKNSEAECFIDVPAWFMNNIFSSMPKKSIRFYGVVPEVGTFTQDTTPTYFMTKECDMDEEDSNTNSAWLNELTFGMAIKYNPKSPNRQLLMNCISFNISGNYTYYQKEQTCKLWYENIDWDAVWDKIRDYYQKTPISFSSYEEMRDVELQSNDLYEYRSGMAVDYIGTLAIYVPNTLKISTWATNQMYQAFPNLENAVVLLEPVREDTYTKISQWIEIVPVLGWVLREFNDIGYSRTYLLWDTKANAAFESDDKWDSLELSLFTSISPTGEGFMLRLSKEILFSTVLACPNIYNLDAAGYWEFFTKEYSKEIKQNDAARLQRWVEDSNNTFPSKDDPWWWKAIQWIAELTHSTPERRQRYF
jgi:hypothetical protein